MITRVQLERHRKKVLDQIEKITFRLQGLSYLEKYYVHCLEGVEKGYDEEIEHGLLMRGAIAKKKYKQKISLIRNKLEICRKEETLILEKMEAIKKDIELCKLNPTSRKNRSKDS